VPAQVVAFPAARAGRPAARVEGPGRPALGQAGARPRA
jgi:hypothetical protein